MGNDLILFPLCKISSLHQPSKCLFSNLACTDISVGLSFRPFHRAYIISQEHCNLLPWLAHQPNLGVHFRWRVCPHTDCNKYRQTSVSLGLRYRQVATLWRLIVTLVLCWLVCITRGITNHSIVPTYLIISNKGVIFSMMTSTFCYIAFYIKLRRQQDQLQA